MNEGTILAIYLIVTYVYVMIDFKYSEFLSGWTRAVLWIISPVIWPVVLVVRMVRIAKHVFGD